jgi:hypothetical protein
MSRTLTNPAGFLREGGRDSPRYRDVLGLAWYLRKVGKASGEGVPTSPLEGRLESGIGLAATLVPIDLEPIRAAIKDIHFGEVRIVIRDGIVIPIDCMEKTTEKVRNPPEEDSNQESKVRSMVI